MPTVTFVMSDGKAVDVSAESGTSVMQAAIDNGIDEILADCGGACVCATCHCFVDPDWVEKVGQKSDIEGALLELVSDLRDNSRLSCQIQITDETDGLVVHLPESQY